MTDACQPRQNVVSFLLVFRCCVCSLTLVCLTYPHNVNPCQSALTLTVTETSSELLRSQPPTPHQYPGRWAMSPMASPTPSAGRYFSANLSELFILHLHLTDSELHLPVYFADAEQSRPFLIRKLAVNSWDNSRNSNNTFFWYQLFSAVPIDRERICSPRHHPERVSVSKICCPSEVKVGSPGSVQDTFNYPCCVFLGVNIASKGTYFIKIEIRDVNDHRPKFQKNILGSRLVRAVDESRRYAIGVLENSLQDTWLPLPEASDEDEGENALIEYSVKLTNDKVLWNQYFELIANVSEANLNHTSTSVPFVLNEEIINGGLRASDYFGPGLLILKSLDRETVSSFVFTLCAADRGSPTRGTGTIEFAISVLDENDNAPLFEKPEYKVNVRENQAGIPLIYLKVTDADTEDNGRIGYQIRPGRKSNAVGFEFLRSHIHVSAVFDGVRLRVSQPLDYEHHSDFTFDVIAIDHGRPPLSSSTVIHVNVENINDHAPEIRFYHMGKLLDRDFTQLHIVEHSDADVNRLQDTVICHVHVTDADGFLSTVTCSVESAEETFALREFYTSQVVQRRKIYELVANRLLDRERMSRYLVVVRCQDGKSSISLAAQGQLQLILTDINDNAPRFSQGTYNGQIAENMANTLVVFGDLGIVGERKAAESTVHAEDMDVGNNALVHYRLIAWQDGESANTSVPYGNYNDFQTRVNTTEASSSHSYDVNFFKIDLLTGQIRTQLALDCERQQVYQFMVLAIDQAEQTGMRQTSTARVVVRVVDENDNPPNFIEPHYTFSIAEGLPRHTLIGQVNTRDADVDQKNQITFYEMVDGATVNASEYFLVER